MDNDLIRKLYCLGGGTPLGLLPSLVNILFISAITLMLLSGYQDYRYQLNKAFNIEAQAEKKLKQPAQSDKDGLILQKSLSDMFRLSHEPVSLSGKKEAKRDYSLTNNELTDEFFMSCPAAEIGASVVGLLTGDSDANDIAIISYQGKESSYRVSDQLDKDVNIVRIFPERAIVNIRGYCAALLMN